MIEQTVVNRRYRVDRPIGEGGMALVYRGHDLLLGRDVAIKALRPQFGADAAFRARFDREAQAAAGFAHPNIIDIYDVGEEDGTPYIVMAYVRGHSLKEIIAAEAPFHPDDVAALLEQVCSALDYAHERGYVHRDVKPQNILVDEQGLARVVDFGIAKGLADSDLTEAGSGLGTVHYLSPEQASGLMATPASDVYAVGVVAFEMLTGRLPFAADSAIGVAMRHVHDSPPPPSAFGPRVPAAVDAIVLRALEKDPTRRFPSAGAFARAMVRWRDNEPADRRPAATSATEIRPSLVAVAGDGDRERRPAAVPAASLSVNPGFAATETPARELRSARPTAPRPVNDRNEIGCATWVAGSAILLGLIGLIWIGFRLSEGEPIFGGWGGIPTESAAPIAPPEAGGETLPADDAAEAAQPTIGPAAEQTPAAPAVVPVPRLVGLDAASAERVANGRGLVVSVVGEVASASVPTGSVAEQEPAPEADGRQGDTVSVRLSTGAARVDLAALDLVGRAADEADALLRERGMGVERSEVASREIPAGAVAAVDPAGEAAAGSTVELRVSVGDLVRIPSAIQGQPIDQVERQLSGLGLRVRQTFGVDRGVIEQFGIDMATDAIDDRDIVGIQGGAGVDFDAWVPPGTEVDLVYYDRAQDQP